MKAITYDDILMVPSYNHLVVRQQSASCSANWTTSRLRRPDALKACPIDCFRRGCQFYGYITP